MVYIIWRASDNFKAADARYYIFTTWHKRASVVYRVHGKRNLSQNLSGLEGYCVIGTLSCHEYFYRYVVWL